MMCSIMNMESFSEILSQLVFALVSSLFSRFVFCFLLFYLIFFYLLPCGFLVIQGTPFIQLGTFQYILIDFWRFVMFLLRSQHILLYLPFT